VTRRELLAAAVAAPVAAALPSSEPERILVKGVGEGRDGVYEAEAGAIVPTPGIPVMLDAYMPRGVGWLVGGRLLVNSLEDVTPDLPVRNFGFDPAEWDEMPVKFPVAAEVQLDQVGPIVDVPGCDPAETFWNARLVVSHDRRPLTLTNV
jgi:hypothetical protein